MVEILKILLFPANLALLFPTDDFLIFHLQNYYNRNRLQNKSTRSIENEFQVMWDFGMLQLTIQQINTNKVITYLWVIMFIQHWNPRKNMKIKGLFREP